MRTRPSLLLVVVLLAPLGCQQDAIETHRVPRELPPPPPEEKVRLLGAMVPHEKHTWFFKLVGPLDAVEKQKANFDSFVSSLKFKGEDVDWKLPEGWEKEPNPPQSGRYATLRAGPKDAALTLTVNRLGDEDQTRSVPANVNRWRNNDLGLKPLARAEVGDATQEVKLPDAVATVVDMKGPGPRAKRPPMAGGMPAEHPPIAEGRLSYKAPEGWKETDRDVTRGGMTFHYEAALKVEKGGASATVTVSQLAGPGGGILSNVNRWRDQLGLSALDKDQLLDAAKEFKVNNVPGLAVDFKGPGRPPGKEERRILGVVVVPREGQTWFIKMDGPADLVGEQKAAFDSFVGSVKFDGGKGG